MRAGGVLAALFAAPAPAAAEEWAVLVAGSSGFFNYRHQADVCHAYQLLTKGGVPAENIITMMYDDIAASPENKHFPGKIFNKATMAGEDPVDVYAGVKIDYRAKAVTPQNFINVLTGNATGMAAAGSGRVLRSGPQDRVFVNFVDHGGAGIIAFPTHELHAKDLVGALKDMHAARKYKELVFYLEACESGSMFANLPKGLNIYATTASNAKESSWATYCAPKHDLVGGQHLGTCLGDLYSVNWLENADKKDLTSETLQSQYNTVKKETLHGEEGGSHVMQFGDLSITVQDASGFEGSGEVYPGPSSSTTPADSGLVDSRDVTVVSLFHQYLSAPAATRSAKAAALIEEVKSREEADARFRAIAAAAGAPDAFAAEARLATPEAADCHVAAVSEVRSRCGGWSDYSLKYVRVIGGLCDRIPVDKVLRAVRSVCAQ